MTTIEPKLRRALTGISGILVTPFDDRDQVAPARLQPVIDRAVKAGDIVRTVQAVDRKLIAGVTVFDVYEGQGIEPGKKSVAVAVTVQPRDKTKTEAEIDALAAKIVAEVGKRTGGVLRT